VVCCPFCRFKFRAKGDLNTHIEKAHGDSRIRKRIKVEPNVCPLCIKKLQNPHGVLTHIRKKKDKLHVANYDLVKRLYVEYEKAKKQVETEKSTSNKVSVSKPSLIKKIFGFGGR